MRPIQVQPKYYTVQEALVVLGVSDPTLRRYLKDGKIPYKQYGNTNRILIPREAIDNL